MLRLVLIEDQRLIREGMFAAIRERMQVELAGAFASRKEVLANAHVLASAEVALLDLDLGEEQALEFLPEIKAAAPALRLIWVTSVTTEYLLSKALDAKLSGFVHKDDPIEVLVTAIERVAEGGDFQSETVQKMQARFRQGDQHFNKLLSRREQELLAFLGQGLSNDETAAIVGLSSSTVRTHRQHIMARLGLHSATELFAYALTTGFSTTGKVQSPLKKK